MNIVTAALALLIAAPSAAPTPSVPAKSAHEHGMAHGAMADDCCKEGRDCCKDGRDCCDQASKHDCCKHEHGGAGQTGEQAR